MQKMLYVNDHVKQLIDKVATMTKKSFSKVVEEALVLWIEENGDIPHKDPVDLLYEAIDLLKKRS